VTRSEGLGAGLDIIYCLAMAVSAHRGQDAEGGAERGDALHRPGRTQDGREIKWRASSYRPARTEGRRGRGRERKRSAVRKKRRKGSQ
jgi:hypothetical protein